MRADERRVLRSAFPDREVDAVDELRDSDARGNHAVRVRFRDGHLAFLKLRTDGDADRNARETAATTYAGEHSRVRTPSVLAADSSFDPPYLATAPVAGSPLSDRWESSGRETRERLARVVGNAVAGVARAGFDEPGRITGGDGEALDLETAPWSDVLATVIGRRADEVPYGDRFADVPGLVGDLIRDRHRALDGAPAALVHDDLRPENVFLAPGAAGPAVIDWEWSFVGDPALGICLTVGRVVERADVPEDRRERLRAALLAGYRAVAGDLPAGFSRRRPIYRVVAFLPKVQTFHLWAPDAPEPVPDLAEWVRGELEDRVAAAREVG